MEIVKQLTNQELSRFQGSLERWRHPLNTAVIYSPGVRFLAEQGKAYWLLDAIASYLVPPVLDPAAKIDSRILSLHFWKLNVAEDHSAVLHAEADFGVKPFVVQEIEHTDFPLQKAEVWAGFDGHYWVLYLPSEH